MATPTFVFHQKMISTVKKNINGVQTASVAQETAQRDVLKTSFCDPRMIQDYIVDNVIFVVVMGT